MKNLILAIVLIACVFVAYFVSETDEKPKLEDTIIFTDFKMVKKGEEYLVDNKVLENTFASTLVSYLKDIEIVNPIGRPKADFLSLKMGTTLYELGAKIPGRDLFILCRLEKCFLAKVKGSKGILYKNDNDLAEKKYAMMRAIFNMKKDKLKFKDD